MINNNIKKVIDFHRAFDLPVGDIQDNISKERAMLRLNLALEELFELSEALGLAGSFSKSLISKATEKLNHDEDYIDKPKVADALGDIEYINNGSILEFGLQHIYEDIYNDIHESNMSKACNTEGEAIETVKYYMSTGLKNLIYKNISGRYLVYREDGKLLKSINYKKVNLEKHF